MAEPQEIAKHSTVNDLTNKLEVVAKGLHRPVHKQGNQQSVFVEFEEVNGKDPRHSQQEAKAVGSLQLPVSCDRLVAQIMVTYVSG